MGNDCFSLNLYSFDLNESQHKNARSGIHQPLLITQNILNSSKLEFKNQKPEQKILSQAFNQSRMQMISPPITNSTIQPSNLEISFIKNQSNNSSLNLAIEDQQKSKAFQMNTPQRVISEQKLQQSMINQIQQQHQLKFKVQKEQMILKHGPPPNLALPSDIPFISEQISNRRKQLKIMKYQGQVKGVMLNPYKFLRNGLVYFGQWNNGQPHGKGLVYFTNGSVFQGGFINGRPQGKGRLIHHNGDYYEGEVVGGSASGKGVSENKQIRYQGLFENNIPHGQGLQINLNGKSKFKGIFEKGTKKNGLLTWRDHQQYIYEGTFHNQLFEGIGILKSSGGIYKGQFSKGKKHGRGRYEWKDGKVYQGEYFDDMKNGDGQLYNMDGTLSYRGKWKQGNANGIGTTIINGKLITGNWVNGQFLG